MAAEVVVERNTYFHPPQKTECQESKAMEWAWNIFLEGFDTKSTKSKSKSPMNFLGENL